MVKKPEYKFTFTAEGFNLLFDYYLTISENHAEAYRKAEEEHKKVCGCTKYSTYDTFKKIRRRYIKGK